MKYQLKSVKVSQLSHLNQYVIINNVNKCVYFQSYDSMIAMLDPNYDLHLSEDWDYSITTLKHLYVFLEQYAYCIWSKIAFKTNKKEAIYKLIKDKYIKVDLEA